MRRNWPNWMKSNNRRLPLKDFMGNQLRVVSGRDVGRVFALQPQQLLLIGRDMSTTTRLKDPQVAMLHCQVILVNDEAVLTDRNSSGGTFVDGQRVNEHHLRPGGVFRIGDTRIRFE
jgi:pSer/pThr/pTyr-binding forkhead associated (FHA) protein